MDGWRFYQQKAEAIVAVNDPVARNRRINAAYARLWIEDHRFQWAGLAAFASKQVGCGLLNAAGMIRKANREREMYQEWDKIASLAERLSPFASPRVSMPNQVVGASGYKVFTMLAKANTALFLEIWPLHMFFKRFGFERFEACLKERRKLRESIYWPDARSDLFAKKEDEIRLGFAAIENLDIAAGVKHLAEHEQLHMLQPILYDDVAFATMMRANHVAWVLNMPSGSVQELQLTLANRCTVTGGDADKVSFSKHPLANLADPVQRMEFVVRAANQFEELLKHRGPDVENSLHIIGNGGR
ncbi:DUF2515 family protein [Cupriavidus campinensis]